MKNAIQDHIASLNWGYRVSLREKNVKYLNAYGEFVGPHKLKVSVRDKHCVVSQLYCACGARTKHGGTCTVRVALVLSARVLVYSTCGTPIFCRL